MSDLISRSELLKAFNNKNVQITFDLPVEEVLGEDVDLDDFAMLVQDAIQAYKKMIIDTIKSQPTAYSVDKAVEELEERKREYLYSFTIHENNELYGIACGLGDAIEIVKQGGVYDGVCEWKKSKDYPFDWLVGCDGCEVNHRQGDYCPRCGKKIKVVE